MANLHLRRPGKAGALTFEKTVVWALWALLLACGGAVGIASLVIGTIDVVLVIVGASTGQDAAGWPKLAWYFIAGILLLVLPWPIVAVIVVGLRQGRRVWPWPAAALVVAVEITLGLGYVYGFF